MPAYKNEKTVSPQFMAFDTLYGTRTTVLYKLQAKRREIEKLEH